MAIHAIVEMYLMDVMIAYMYSSLDIDVYMQIPPDLKTRNLNSHVSRRHHISIKLL